MNRFRKAFPFICPRKRDFLVLLAATLILLIRKTHSFLNPQFWAEDGTVFCLDQYNIGAAALFKPYAGYLHLAPRVIALFADSFFPYSAIPAVYNYFSMLLTLFVISQVLSPRLFVGNKALLASAIVLVPHYENEVFLNIANLQWILAVLLVITLIKELPHLKYGNIYRQAALDISIVIVCGLTGPFIILLVPFFAWKWHRNKCVYSSTLLLIVFIVSSVQLAFMLNGSFSLPGATQYDINAYISILGYKLFGNLFLGPSIPYEISPYILLCLLLGLLCVLGYFSIFETERRWLAIIFLGFTFEILLTTIIKFKANPAALIPGKGLRYYYVPYVMLVWSMIICLNQKEKWKNSLIKLLLIFVLISSLISGFHSEPWHDYNWQAYSEFIGSGNHLSIPINPEGWFIEFSGK